MPEDITFYRTYGGGAKANGSFVTTHPSGNRINAKIDTVLVPDWKNTREFEAVVEVPKGQILNIGRVEKQFTKTGALPEGDADQILLPQRWPSEWRKDIRKVPSYINSAITIEYYNNFIMDFSLWDFVDQLWSYLIQLVEDVVQTGYGTTYFPDQPVKIEMKVVSIDLLLFALDEGEIIRELLPMQEFINALLKSAENFYSSFIAYFAREIDFSYELN